MTKEFSKYLVVKPKNAIQICCSHRRGKNMSDVKYCSCGFPAAPDGKKCVLDAQLDRIYSRRNRTKRAVKTTDKDDEDKLKTLTDKLRAYDEQASKLKAAKAERPVSTKRGSKRSLQEDRLQAHAKRPKTEDAIVHTLLNPDEQPSATPDVKELGMENQTEEVIVHTLQNPDEQPSATPDVKELGMNVQPPLAFHVPVREEVVKPKPVTKSCRGFMEYLSRNNPTASQVKHGVIMASGDIASGPSAGRGGYTAGYKRLAGPMCVDTKHKTTLRQQSRQTVTKKLTQKDYKEVRDENHNADGSYTVKQVKQGRERIEEHTWTNSFTHSVMSVQQSSVPQKDLTFADQMASAFRLLSSENVRPAVTTFDYFMKKTASSWFGPAVGCYEWPKLVFRGDVPDIHDIFDHMVDCWPMFCEVWKGLPERRVQQFERDSVKCLKTHLLAQGLRWTPRDAGSFAMHPIMDSYLMYYLYPREGGGERPESKLLYFENDWFSQLHGWELTTQHAYTRFTGMLVDIGRRHRQKVVVTTDGYLGTREAPGWLAVKEVAEKVKHQEYKAVSDGLKRQCSTSMGGHLPEHQIASMCNGWMQKKHCGRF
jgi:hypothetical protein